MDWLPSYALRNNPPWFGMCECGRGRWFTAKNLRTFPPKTHRFCYRGVTEAAPELPLDSVRKQAYEKV